MRKREIGAALMIAALLIPTAALAIGPAWGMEYAEVLLLGTPMFVAFAVGTLPAGWLGDRMDRMMLIAVFFPVT